MQHVFVVDTTRRPLMPCRPARACQLLSQHRAAVLRRYPFTIILATAKPEAVVVPLSLKIDPGSRTTGLALVRETMKESIPTALPPARTEAGSHRREARWCGLGNSPTEARKFTRRLRSAVQSVEPGGSSTPAIVPPALPTGPDLQSGCPVARESGAASHDLGTAPEAVVPCGCALARSGTLRYAAAAKPGYCWCGVSARDPGWHRGPGISAPQVELSLCVLPYGSYLHESLGD